MPTIAQSIPVATDSAKFQNVTLNGKATSVREGELLVDVINRERIQLAQVCYHPQLGPIETCDTCLVEVNGMLVRACGTRVDGGETVATHSPRAKQAQHDAFDRILGNHELYCTVCDKNNDDCTVHNTTKLLDVQHQKTPFRPKPYEIDLSNPFYRYDPSQCILCGRCVEACQNVQVNETLTINWESPNPRVLWDGGTEIAGSSCVSCGHCITVCPCNALMEKSMLGEAGFFTDLPRPVLDKMIDFVKGVEPEIGYGPILQVSEVEAAMRHGRIKKTKTVCTYCGVGCSFDIWTKGRHILKVHPEHGDANGISTCVKGKFGWDYVNSQERITKPLIREDGAFREATWDEALNRVEAKLKQLKQAHGPDSIGVVISSKCSNEESYIMQKLARAVIGTNNVDNCSRYCQSPATTGLFRTVGYGGDSGSIKDLETAGLVMIVGANAAENHPVLATRIKRAHKLKGQRLIVADLRKNEMGDRADIFFRPNPGTDLVWLSAVTRYLIDNNLHNREFIDRWVNGFEEYRESLEPFTLEFAEGVTGVSVEVLRQVADEIAKTDRTCICWAMGVTQHCGGSDTSTAISNLLLATGNYMRPGTGAYPLRGHNNVQGASDFGAMPDYFPGYQKVEEQQIREKFERGWGVTLPAHKGLDNHQMAEAIQKGSLKAMILAGEDMYTADSNSNFIGDSFSKLELFVVFEVFFTKTCHYADVILPAASSLEKDGTFTNTERRIQRFYKVFDPPGEATPDWRISQLIANRLGAKWNYKHPSELMHEAAALSPTFAGVHYDRLEGYKTLQWPVAEDGKDTPLLYTEKFHFPDGKARFYKLDWIEPSEQPNEEYDLHVNNGRLLEHFEVGNMTYQVKGIAEITPEPFVEISPELAAQRGIETGRYLQLESKFGLVRVRALVTDRVRGKELFLSLNTHRYPVNVLTSSNTDRTTHTPAFKEVAVRMRVLPDRGASPLPRQNFRNGHRTPQTGVEVERKWKRSDYELPGKRGLIQISPNGKHDDTEAVKKSRTD